MSRVETRGGARMQKYLKKVINGESLSELEAEEAMEIIMEGKATPAQIGAVLTALKLKGETIGEITGFARSMRRHAEGFETDEYVVDTCGTGGDQAGTFNISTTAAFVVAGAGVPVAKHGNRSVSSKCGSADVLEQLGVRVDLNAEQAAQCLHKTGMTFLFAPAFHKATKYAVGPRRELGVRTIFNVLGPLTNPVKAQIQVLGVFEPELTEPMAGVLNALGSKRAFVVHGSDGLDEITITGPSRITELNAGFIHTYDFDPRQIGMHLGRPEDLTGGDPSENAEMLLNILNGEQGPRRDVVILNSAFALLAANREPSLEEAVDAAEKSIDLGYAAGKLTELIDFTESCVL